MKPPGISVRLPSRPGDPRLREIVRTWDGFTPLHSFLPSNGFGILGWPDDRGVRLNGGRPGAAEGPKSIRKYFLGLTPGPNSELMQLPLVDLGDLRLDGTIESCHERAARYVEQILLAGIMPLCLGGGNDYAYADLLGLKKGIGKKDSIGAINIDAHFDVRDPSEGCNSGTPYFRALEGVHPLLSGKCFVEFAAQKHRNAADHVRFLKTRGARVIWLEDIQLHGARTVFSEVLRKLARSCDALAVSLDIDSVQMADAPGCSAPSPNGLSARDVEEIAVVAGVEPKVRLFSIYEVSPPLDRGDQTSRLAASVLWHFCASRAATLNVRSGTASARR